MSRFDETEKELIISEATGLGPTNSLPSEYPKSSQHSAEKHGYTSSTGILHQHNEKGSASTSFQSTKLVSKATQNMNRKLPEDDAAIDSKKLKHTEERIHQELVENNQNQIMNSKDYHKEVDESTKKKIQELNEKADKEILEAKQNIEHKKKKIKEEGRKMLENLEKDFKGKKCQMIEQQQLEMEGLKEENKRKIQQSKKDKKEHEEKQQKKHEDFKRDHIVEQSRLVETRQELEADVKSQQEVLKQMQNKESDLLKLTKENEELKRKFEEMENAEIPTETIHYEKVDVILTIQNHPSEEMDEDSIHFIIEKLKEKKLHLKQNIKDWELKKEEEVGENGKRVFSHKMRITFWLKPDVRVCKCRKLEPKEYANKYLCKTFNWRSKRFQNSGFGFRRS